MALKDGARIKETSVTSGAGALSLGGAVLGHQAILDELATADTFRYWLLDANGLGWEYGEGVITSGSPNTLTRVTIFGSSNGGAAISLTIPAGANTHFVFSAPMPGMMTGDIDFGNTLQSNMLLQSYNEVTPTPAIAAGVLNLDFAAGRVQSVSLTENVTSLTFSNLPASGVAATVTLKLAQDATGSRTFAFPASVKFSGGAAPTLSSGASEYDWLTFITLDGGTTYDLFVGGQAFA